MIQLVSLLCIHINAVAVGLGKAKPLVIQKPTGRYTFFLWEGQDNGG